MSSFDNTVETNASMSPSELVGEMSVCQQTTEESDRTIEIESHNNVEPPHSLDILHSAVCSVMETQEDPSFSK